MKLVEKAYEHKFKEGSLLVLKSSQALIQITDELEKEFLDTSICLSDISWFLNEEKKDELEKQTLKVDVCIFWHMGIPFYKVDLNKKNSYFIAEFYLREK